MSLELKPGMIVQHFKRVQNTVSDEVKNKYLYQILAIAQHTETDEQMLVYQALYKPFQVYVRPMSMVTEPLDKEKYPYAKQDYRLVEVKDDLYR